MHITWVKEKQTPPSHGRLGPFLYPVDAVVPPVWGQGTALCWVRQGGCFAGWWLGQAGRTEQPGRAKESLEVQ